MRKYIEVAIILFKTQLVYRFDVAMTALGTVSRIVFAWILWGAVFEGRTEVAGLSFQAMLSYYVISSLIRSLDLSDGVISEVSDRIRGGTFSRFMTIPAQPLHYFVAQTLGAAGYYALFAALAAALCTAAFRIELTLASDPLSVLLAMLMTVMGLVFMISYQFTIGVLAFKFGDTGFFRHVQGMVLEFATGAVVPLSMLPGHLADALDYLPFPHVLFTPAMLITGQSGANQGLFGLAVLSAWTAGMMITAQMTYQHLRVKFDGVGV